MKNKFFQQKKRSGLSNADLLRIDALAKRAEGEYIEKAYLLMLAIPLNVLVTQYWSKTAKSKAPKFIDDCLSLYESFQAGCVSYEELRDLLYEYSGVEIHAEWLKRDLNDEK